MATWRIVRVHQCRFGLAMRLLAIALTAITLASAPLAHAQDSATTVDKCHLPQALRDELVRQMSATSCDQIPTTAANVWLTMTGIGAVHIPANAFDGLTITSMEITTDGLVLDRDSFKGLSITSLDLIDNYMNSLPAGVFDSLTGLTYLSIGLNQLTALPAGIFDKLTELTTLYVGDNPLTTLPMGVFDKLTKLEILDIAALRWTTIPPGFFDKMATLTSLSVGHSPLTALPSGIFDKLTNLSALSIRGTHLTTLPDGVFDKLTKLERLGLAGNRLTSLPVGIFDNLTELSHGLDIDRNQLEMLPTGIFDNLIKLKYLNLVANPLSSLQAGVFDNLSEMRTLHLSILSSASFPNGVFDKMLKLKSLEIAFIPYHEGYGRHLPCGTFDYGMLTHFSFVGSKEQPAPCDEGDGSGDDGDDGDDPNDPDDPVDGEDPDDGDDGDEGDDPTEDGDAAECPVPDDDGDDASPTPVSPRAATIMVPFFPTATHSGAPDGFIRVINESDVSGTVQITGIDDGGNKVGPIELTMDANQARHLNSGNLENGRADKGLTKGLGRPREGDNWRLTFESDLSIDVLSYVRFADFLTSMHDVVPTGSDGKLWVRTFNPASNTERESRLRLINTDDQFILVNIEGVDDAGGRASVSLSLDAGHSRTLTALDLEEGTQGLAGTLGNGTGKWRLYIQSDEQQSLIAMSLLYNTQSGHISNLSAVGGQ